MRNLLLIIGLLFPVILNSQIIDWENFSEERMNEVMFNEMNAYVRKIHSGDSLVLSNVIKEEIMPRNYKLISSNYTLPLHSLHNMEWFIPGRGNDLNDTLRNKIIHENANPNLLKSLWLERFKCYGLFCYTEILESVSYKGFENGKTYQEVAIKFIQGWNASPPHAGWMNANYHNKVIVGVATFFDKQNHKIFISFVHVS